jgi:hypothetical protein
MGALEAPPVRRVEPGVAEVLAGKAHAASIGSRIVVGGGIGSMGRRRGGTKVGLVFVSTAVALRSAPEAQATAGEHGGRGHARSQSGSYTGVGPNGSG